jgi:hypothetical protein
MDLPGFPQSALGTAYRIERALGGGRFAAFGFARPLSHISPRTSS